MELLRIDPEHKAFFNKAGNWVPVIDIEKEDILALVRNAASNEDIDMDECTEERFIVNPVEKTIYEQLYLVINDLVENRETYCAEINQRFEEIKASAALPHCLEKTRVTRLAIVSEEAV